MLRIPVLCVVVVCSILAVTPSATGQVVSSDEVPEGLTAADWSSIRGAYKFNGHAIDRDEEGGKSYSQVIDSIVQQAYLKASNTDASDRFGVSMAVSGNTMVVSATREDSGATGVGGDQADNSFCGCWSGLRLRAYRGELDSAGLAFSVGTGPFGRSD